MYRAYTLELGESKVVDLSRFKEGGADASAGQHLLESEKRKIKSKYKKVTRKLFDQYRGMPYHVVKTSCGTKSEKASVLGVASVNADGSYDASGLRYSPRTSYYIPFVDPVLMHKLLTKECFSPEWGGHQLWVPEGDTNDVKDAVEQFIIDSHNLGVLTEELIRELDQRDGQPGMNVRGIHESDLLDPVDRLIRSGKISTEEAMMLFGLKMKNVDEFGYRVGFNNNSSVLIAKKFGRWAYSPGRFYQVGMSTADRSSSGPHAYIKMMNTIFPRAKDRKRIASVQDPESSDMITSNDMYDHTTKIMRGYPNTSRFYPAGGVKVKKSGGVIGAYLYAGAIGEYLRSRIDRDLLDIRDRRDIKKKSMQMVGHVKYSKKLKTDIYSVGIVMDEDLMGLWNLLTK